MKAHRDRVKNARPCWVQWPDGRILSYASLAEVRAVWAEAYEGYTVSPSEEGHLYFRNPQAYPDPRQVPPPDRIVRMGRGGAVRVEEV